MDGTDAPYSREQLTENQKLKPCKGQVVPPGRKGVGHKRCLDSHLHALLSLVPGWLFPETGGGQFQLGQKELTSTMVLLYSHL
jgi:hypothetical protein